MGEPTEKKILKQECIYSIVSPCVYGLAGIEVIINQHGGEGKAHQEKNTMIVLIPAEPLPALQSLQILVNALLTESVSFEYLILSDIAPCWLYASLVRMTGSNLLVDAVSLLPLQTNVQYLRYHLSVGAKEIPFLSDIVCKGKECTSCQKNKGLSQCEADVMTETLKGVCIKKMVARKKRSCKTLYQQKKSGMKKLSEVFPHIVMRTSGQRRRSNQTKSDYGPV